MTGAKAVIQQLVTEQAPEVFNADYIARQSAELTEQETLGILISQWVEWDGLAILRVAISAPEDSNFHSEAELLEQFIEPIEDDLYLSDYELVKRADLPEHEQRVESVLIEVFMPAIDPLPFDELPFV